MSKISKRLDNQPSIFDLLTVAAEEFNGAPESDFDLDRRFRESISQALKNSPLSRYQIAARMSELVGQDITKTMLDSWTAESKENHRFPAIYVPAFCEAAGDTGPLMLLSKPVKVFCLPGPEALRAEIQRLDEEISRKQREKKKRLTFLKEMEEVHK
jgi:hypothetical protein